jgi:hypothetical protein
MSTISNFSFEGEDDNQSEDGSRNEGEADKCERLMPVKKISANVLFIKLTTTAHHPPITGQPDFQFRLKIGTCEHCVLEQSSVPFGKPERAWLPNPNDPDADLDFDRDALLEGLRTLGVAVETGEQYICP